VEVEAVSLVDTVLAAGIEVVVSVVDMVVAADSKCLVATVSMGVAMVVIAAVEVASFQDSDPLIHSVVVA